MNEIALPTVPTVDARFYDNSMVSTYKDCPRKFYLRYVRDWRSEGIATPLAFGLAWHCGQDVVWEYARKLGSQDHLARTAMAAFLESWEAQGLPAELDIEQTECFSPRTPSVAHEMYANYIEARWNILVEAQILAIEQPFAVPIPEAEDLWYIGRLDKVIQHNQQKLVIEHKTTTEYKKDGGFRSTYVDSWDSDSQVKGYEYGGGLYFGTEQVWVDAALVHKSVHNAFRFIPVAHQMPLLQEWVGDTKNWIDRIEADKKKGYFPKNEGSCVGKYGPCSFLDICRTTHDPDRLQDAPPGYMVEKWSPFELLNIADLINKGVTSEKDTQGRTAAV